ncbi:phage holin [Radiobacillus kanasensis]|uniref:phage holin n=1 Tax=Radiobacillus kanasensis TaxID=2844358 RepID=UPI001E44316F|nr:phage holin [Radiobacillus kanasensis]UFU00837.1 phage holin [Radiobacillus kanasensis]
MDKDTLIRSLLLFVAVTNQVLVFLGHSTIPVGNPMVEQIIATIFTVISSFIVWFKTNYLTKTGKLLKKILNQNGLLRFKKKFKRWNLSLSLMPVMAGKK